MESWIAKQLSEDLDDLGKVARVSGWGSRIERLRRRKRRPRLVTTSPGFLAYRC